MFLVGNIECVFIENIKYKIMQNSTSYSPINISDDELMQIKSDFSMNVEQLNKISKKYESILQMPIKKANLLLVKGMRNY